MALADTPTPIQITSTLAGGGSVVFIVTSDPGPTKGSN